MNGEKIQRELDRAVEEGVFPGCALEVGFKGETVFSLQSGRCSTDPLDKTVASDTIFDLGSLTKPLVTASALMVLYDRKTLHLDQPLSEILDHPFPLDKRSMTPRHLLCHSAGLPAWRPFFRDPVSGGAAERKKAVRERILEEPLEYLPGRGFIYSDLGFILLEWLVEILCNDDMGAFFDKSLMKPLGLSRTFVFRRERDTGHEVEEFAATEDCPWRGRVLRGEVHDENAFALGGYSGHAGLFGSAGEVLQMAKALRGHFLGIRRDLFQASTVRLFFERQRGVPGCARALGWDMPAVQGSSSGRFFSSSSVGHLGFPGTSLWMDLEKDVQVVFLSNRIHPSRENDAIRLFRPRIHDTVREAVRFL